MPDLRKRSVRPLLPPKESLAQIEWPLERAAFRFLWLLLLLCPFWWLIDSLEPTWQQSRREKRRWDQQRAYWVLFWLVVLVAMWLVNPEPTSWKVVFAVLAGIRLLEVFTTSLGTVLKQAQQVRARNLVTFAIYAVQITLIFAILFHSLAAMDFGTRLAHPTKASDYLYMSWSDMASLGNNAYAATTRTARFLEVLTTTSSILLFGVLLAFGIDAVKEKQKP